MAFQNLRKGARNSWGSVTAFFFHGCQYGCPLPGRAYPGI